MILPEVALFPQALLPLRIFEPRYVRMLVDVLEGNRLFVIAMQRPNYAREVPSTIAGLGMVRVSVDNPDGTSHLIIQGVQRVELTGTVRYKPYRIHTIEPVLSSQTDPAQITHLLTEVRNLVTERIALGATVKPAKPSGKTKKSKSGGLPSIKEIMACLDQLKNPEELVDLVSCALLPGGSAQQTILETPDLEPRIHHLIGFLNAEIRMQKENRFPGRP